MSTTPITIPQPTNTSTTTPTGVTSPLTPMVPATNPNGATGTAPTITGTGLAGTTTPASTAVVPPSTGSAGLQGVVDTSQDSYTAGLQSKADAASATSSDSLAALLKAMTAGGSAENTNTAYQENGVDQADTDLSNVNEQISGEKNALANQVAAIKANKEGTFGGAVDQAVQAATDASLQRQASLAVIQTAAQGKYDIAKGIADRQAAAATEADQNKVNTLQTVYEANKDMFSTEEQQAFSAAQTDRQNKIDATKTQMGQVSDLAITALKNGAPTSVATAIQNAPDLASAEAAAGTWLKTPTTPTAATTKDGTFAGINKLLGINPATGKGYTLDASDPNSPAITDKNGKITPEGWSAIVQNGAETGLSVNDLLDEYAGKLDPHSAQAYGLTAKQQTDYGIDNDKPSSGFFGL